MARTCETRFNKISKTELERKLTEGTCNIIERNRLTDLAEDRIWRPVLATAKCCRGQRVPFSIS